MNIKLLDNLTEEDLTEDLKLLMDVCDMETVKKLLYNLPATQIYIPRIASLRSFVARCALEKSENASIRKTAYEIGVSRRFLEELIKSERKKSFELLKTKQRTLPILDKKIKKNA